MQGPGFESRPPQKKKSPRFNSMHAIHVTFPTLCEMRKYGVDV
jgi:hypothetical protein